MESFHVLMPFRLALGLLPLPLIKRRDFRPIAARPHAAPTPAVVFCPVVEVEHAGRIFAFFNVGRISVAQQIARRFSHGPEQLARRMNFQSKPFGEPLVRRQDFRISDQFAQLCIDLAKRQGRHRFAPRHGLDQRVQHFSKA